MNWTWTLAMVVAASSAAAAQDGGKLSWRGKNEDPKTVLAEARAQGRPSLLFFTSAGCKYCKIISDGAFSDPQIVDASSGLVCIFVDCDWGKKNEELSNEFRVTGYPTIAFCDPKGKDIGRMQGREIPEVLREIQEITRKYPAAPAPAGAPAKPTLQEYSPALLPVARKSSHTVLIFFYDESQATETVVRSLSDPLLRDLRSRLLLSQTPYRKDSELCVRLDVIRAPTLLLLDPSREKPETQPLGRIAGSRSPRELLRDLEELLGGGAAKTPAAAAPPAAPPETALTDDEVDRRFIQAKIAVALDANKRGKKAKAIEILEELLLSFPKHVLTKDVKVLLESMKK